jgi:S-DNA-T family DNA segregation ATPase FtsK/SpoIIIE
MRYSNRKTGIEWRAAMWTARHPGMVVVPGALGASTVLLGPSTTGAITGGALTALGSWYRAHPDSFDYFAAPVLRAWRRRWFSRYTGRWWKDAMLAVDLAPAHRKTGEHQVPRITKFRSPASSVDTVYVRMIPGQTAKLWESKTEELTVALNAERVGIERIKPQIIALVVQRRESFTEVLEAPEMSWDADAVDLMNVVIGEDEYGNDWRVPVVGQHIFGAGATGSGKGSLVWSLLRALAPLIRDGLVRLWVLDPKRMELVKTESIAYRYAAEPEDCVEVVEEFVKDLERVQRMLAEQGERKFSISRETPLNLLIIDEMAALLGFGDVVVVRAMKKALSYVGTQGRATGHSMCGFVQEPTKEVVPVRDLFTMRICLRVTSAAHVDMALGENARLRGALADEIPNDASTAGIGYVVREKSRVPLRVRASYVDDSEIDELIEFVTSGRTGGLKVVA